MVEFDHKTLMQAGDVLLAQGDVEDALFAYRRALDQLPPADALAPWFRALAKYSNALLQRREGDRSENVEAAIAACREPLERFAPSELKDVLYFPAGRVTARLAGAPEGRAGLFDQLGHGYMHRLEGDRAENVEIALRAYTQARADTDPEAEPVDWAVEGVSLASAFSARLEGDPHENLTYAIELLEEAADIFAREGDVQRWLPATMNLATALLGVSGDERPASLRRAIDLYDRVLKVRTREVDPVGWASTTLAMAAAYLNAPELGGARKTAALCKEALTEPALEQVPLLRAEALFNLGVAYQTADGPAGAKLAARAFRDAIAALPPWARPEQRADALRRLANLYFDERRWASAEPLFAEAILLETQVLERAVYEAGRRTHAPSDLHPRYAYCLLRRAKFAEALFELEAGKTRLLAMAVALTATRLEALDADLREAIAGLRASIRELEQSREREQQRTYGLRLDDSDFVAALAEARGKLTRLLAEARERRPGLDLDVLAVDDILALAPEGGALVAPVFTSKGSAVFVIPHGTASVAARHVLWLEDFTTADLNALLDMEADGAASSLEAVTEALWAQLGRRVLGRLKRLKVRRAVFLAQGGLGLLPMHAARRDEKGQERYLADDVEITYAPSAYALDTARRRAAGQPGRAGVVMGVSRSERFGDLRSVEAEARKVAGLLGSEALLDSDATVAALVAAAPSASYLHLACHGVFAWGTDPLASALYLAGDAALSLEDIIGRLDLESTRLVTLSACESGVVETHEAPDEFFGLTAGFIQAGATGVLSSLWPVDDLSTELLMERFYNDHLKGEMEPSAALHEAQQWLRGLTRESAGRHLLGQGRRDESSAVLLAGRRDERPYASPYHWAAFTYNGV